MATLDRVNDPTLEELDEHVRGSVLEPGDEGYDNARTVWNAMIDRHPAVIVQAAGTADVIAAVDFARERNLLLSVKGGGHHVSGAAVCDDGVMIDLSPMNAIRVDPQTKTARVEAGAIWGDVDHETQAFGLAVPGGQDPNIGVAGLTLGGGVGWLSRKYGLTCDNLLSADLVTANGELVRASETEHPELFWGLRGGGGNFGVVTSFEFQLHEVGPEIFAGSLIYSFEDVRAVARHYRDFIADAPREVRTLFGVMVLPAASYYPEEVHDTRVAMIITSYAGPPEQGKQVLAPLREFGEPVMDSLRERSYTAFQRAGESQLAVRTYVRSQYLATFSESAIKTIAEYTEDVPSPGATVFVSPRSGAETEPPSDATAYPHRDASHHLLIEARWDEPAADDEHIAWVREFYEAMGPYTTGDAAMNFLTNDESDDRIRAAYGDNYGRLAELKASWDPENLLSMNQNVEPTG
jgi:FAD/FMN-containing dehydrogenase